MPGKSVYSNLRTKGGISFEYLDLIESDFTASAGSAYTPPEEGDFRRIDVSRAIQLLSDSPVVVETFQTSASSVRLPANTASIIDDDAGNGRMYFVKNSGVGVLTIADYLGVTKYLLKPGRNIFILGNRLNNWDILDSRSIPFDNSTNDFKGDSAQEAVEEIDFREDTGEPTGFIDRTECTISFDDATRTFTIAPVGSDFNYYSLGHKFTVSTTNSVQITDTEGLWFIYYASEMLTASQIPWDFTSGKVFVSNLYWDAVNKISILFGEERHGIVMDGATHEYTHRVHGAEVTKGSFVAGDYILSGDGSSNTHAQLSLTDGVLYDEDIKLPIVNAATPSNPFEQILSPIAKLPIYYRGGTEVSPVWRKRAATNFPVYDNSPNTIFYNNLNAGNWTLANAADRYYVATWVVVTNNIFEPVVCLLGNKQSATIKEAIRTNVLEDIRDSLFLQEKKFIYRLIWKTSTEYTNTPKAVLIAISSDVKGEVEPPPSGISTFPFDLHFVSGTGLNTQMSNGSFFRVRPGTFASGSYSGYPAAFPLQMPFRSKLYSIVLTFRLAAFDFSAVSGPLLFELEFREHYYNGSDVKTRLLVSFGDFSGNQTPTDTWRYELFEDSFSYIDPLLPQEFQYAEVIGVRFVKAPAGDRRINSFRDIVMKLNFEEVV